MKLAHTTLTSAAALILATASLAAQQTNHIELKLDPANRTLIVTADDRISVDPDVAILHIGFTTQPQDAKSAYAEGAKASNNIIEAIKAAGIPESAIRSEWQRLSAVNTKQHKFQLSQQWTVRTPPARAAEILDLAVNAGATDSGDIDWTVNDPQALEDQVLKSAAQRAKTKAQAIAEGLEVKLGKIIYATNQVSSGSPGVYANTVFSEQQVASLPMSGRASAPPIAIEPHKVIRTAEVYAVFSIE
jgi:uncharacterized protein YggE